MPGLSLIGADGVPDVIRGEETQILGQIERAPAAGATRHAVVLPGTHSKWAFVEGGRIVWFATFMTGEVFGLLKEHSILGRLMTGDAPDAGAFARGLAYAPGGPGGLLKRLFSVRTLGLFDRLPASAGASYLSGLLIGSELGEALACLPAGEVREVTVIGEIRAGRALPDGDRGGRPRGPDRHGGGERARATGDRAGGGVDRVTAWQERLAALPLIAILRGIRPEEAVAIGTALVEAGFVAIEVPLNSPAPLVSIERLAAACGERALIGAGTVLEPAQVAEIAAAGGRLIVMPHGDPAVIATAKAAGLLCMPGVATPTEAFAALRAGADALKLFPAEALPPAVVKAWRAVLPATVWLLPVGGIAPETMAPYLAAGANGFGLGSALYRAGMAAGEVGERARAFRDAHAAAVG